MKIRSITAVVAAAAFACTSFARADTWPSRPIRLVYPGVPGGGPERVIRTLAEGVGKRLGQPVIIDYKSGAGGNLGASELARSAPDGYTWMLAPETVLTINPLVYKSLGFRPEAIIPVNLVGSLSQVLVCNPAVGAKTLPELINVAKTKNLTYASAGVGSQAHMTMEMFLEAAKIKMTHVPYRGPAAVTTDLLGGQVDCYFGVASSVAEYVKSNRVAGLAVSTKSRSDMLPNVPTVQEQGIKDFDATFYFGVFAPKGVPQDVLTKFAKALDETVQTPELKEAMAANGVRPEGMTPQAAQQELLRLAKRWGVVARKTDLKAE